MERRQYDRLEQPGRRQSDRRPPGAENRRILLVGPDEAWRLLVAYVFEEAGYAVYAAANRHQAVAFTKRLLPDAILVQMEAPDTLHTLVWLLDAASPSDIPVVVLTSSHEEKDMVASYTLGVNAYVVKPVDFHEFVNAIKELGIFWAVINEPPPGSVKKK